MPLQEKWDVFEIYRKKIWIISQCRWILGQLANVLNYLYDSTYNRIFLTQSNVTNIFVPVFAEVTAVFAPEIGETTTVFCPTSGDLPKLHPMIINVPAVIYTDSVMLSDLVSTVEKIRPCGLRYTIDEITS
jgi:hypothetical protein